MAAHARLKNGFMEEEKYLNLTGWLIYFFNYEAQGVWDKAFDTVNNTPVIHLYNLKKWGFNIR